MWRGLALTFLMASAAVAKEAEQDPWLSFVPGRFALIGQEPGGGGAYAGEATIAARGGGFVLRRTVAGKTSEAEGKIEVPSPPGEGKVLRFRFEGGEAGEAGRSMTCLVSSDLDNYARLSCLWGVAGRDAIPGREAYFSTDAQAGDG